MSISFKTFISPVMKRKKVSQGRKLLASFILQCSAISESDNGVQCQKKSALADNIADSRQDLIDYYNQCRLNGTMKLTNPIGDDKSHNKKGTKSKSYK